MTTTCFRALHLPVYGFMEEYHLLPSSLMMGLWCSHLPCCTLPPPVCVSSLIWLSPARRCYTTSGFAHTHTHREKNVIKRHKEIRQFIWWPKKTISRGMQWLSISKRSKFKDQGRGPSHPHSPFVPSNRYSQICTVCLCLVSLPCLCIGSVYDMMICLFCFCFIFFIFKFLHFVNKVLLYILFQHDIAQ